VLDLSRTAVTDAGLVHLSELTELQLLWLDGTRVSQAGRMTLQRMLPSVRVYLE